MNPQYQEEHRLAALAAGYDCAYAKEVGAFYDRKTGLYWHPDSNRYDTFDLMVACGMVVDSANGLVNTRDYDLSARQEFDPKDSESAMLAIFKCAVAIGRKMEAKK